LITEKRKSLRKYIPAEPAKEESFQEIEDTAEELIIYESLEKVHNP